MLTKTEQNRIKMNGTKMIITNYKLKPMPYTSKLTAAYIWSLCFLLKLTLLLICNNQHGVIFLNKLSLKPTKAQSENIESSIIKSMLKTHCVKNLKNI